MCLERSKEKGNTLAQWHISDILWFLTFGGLTFNIPISKNLLGFGIQQCETKQQDD